MKLIMTLVFFLILIVETIFLFYYFYTQGYFEPLNDTKVTTTIFKVLVP